VVATGARNLARDGCMNAIATWITMKSADDPTPDREPCGDRFVERTADHTKHGGESACVVSEAASRRLGSPTPEVGFAFGEHHTEWIALKMRRRLPAPEDRPCENVGHDQANARNAAGRSALRTGSRGAKAHRAQSPAVVEQRYRYPIACARPRQPTTIALETSPPRKVSEGG
jgi:hypothetical protein